MTIDVLDTIHDPGKPGGPNDDDLGHASNCAWVFDGATGLGDTQLTGTASDAAWLAQAGSAALKARAPSHRGPLTALAEEVLSDVARRFDAEADRQPAERFERPTASLILKRHTGGVVDCLNFGDCKVLLRDGTGAFHSFGSNEESESYENNLASRFSEQRKTEGESGAPDQHRSSFLDRLRKVRNRHNVSGGYWVFGLDPEAAEHARTRSFPITAPAIALMMTDGFEALAGDYGRYTEEALLDAALDRGLASLKDELRHIERELDPEAHQFPRFKQSDDATAMLVKLG
ncbi:protein phosphatase 2C domain-containing protein [Pyruvatibacter mobilis]|uniref:protein phosphatase 2C domain-containing protein n=1 Tax=Pyruvatibacter mobilis TaxID=1712261 RepID=UPI003C7EA114